MKKRVFNILILSLLMIVICSFSVFAVDGDEASAQAVEFNPYQTCYDLFNTYIYGGTVVEGTYEDLVCIQVSTLACLFLFALPFLVVFWVIRRVC